MDYLFHMRRIPVALLIAAAIAVGVTVTIIIQVVALQPSGGVVLLIQQGYTSKTFVYKVLSGGTAAINHFMPIGYGKFTLKSNTTNWYYYIDTYMPGIIAVNKPFTGVVTVTVDGTDYYLCNSSNYGAVIRVHDYIGWVGDWVKVGSYYILNPRNATDATGYVDCAKSVINTAGWTYLLVYEPRGDYFTYDASTKSATVYYDSIDSAGTITAKYGSTVFTPSWTELPANTDTVVGTYSATSDYAYIHYPSLIYSLYNGTVVTQLQVTPTS
jgi:hypothetical protein